MPVLDKPRVKLRVLKDEGEVLLDFQKAEICSACGGACCKSMPGSSHPDEWGQTEEEIEERVFVALASRKYVLDWWEGDPRQGDDLPSEWEDRLSSAHYIRPAGTRELGVYEFGWFSVQCNFLTNAGCSLEHDQRPMECRSLEPAEGESCHSHGGGQRHNAIAWIPFHAVLHRAASRVERGERPGDVDTSTRSHGSEPETTEA